MSNAFSVLINNTVFIFYYYDKLFIYNLCTFNIFNKTNIYLLRMSLEYYEKSFECKLFPCMWLIQSFFNSLEIIYFSLKIIDACTKEN